MHNITGQWILSRVVAVADLNKISDHSFLLAMEVFLLSAVLFE